jgi:hypothetical protein
MLNIKSKLKSKFYIYILEVVIDVLNDYLIYLKSGKPMTPLKVEQDNERDNPISQDFITKLFKTKN